MWIRLATDNDLDAIAGIEPGASTDVYRRSLILQGIEQDGCWIAGRAGPPEGCLVMLRRHFFGRDFVALVDVKESARRQGLASALLQAAETGATTGRLFTSTNQSNHPMRALLAARGYLEAGVIDFLDEGDPEIVYMRDLA